jgi:hypothetical protein
MKDQRRNFAGAGVRAQLFCQANQANQSASGRKQINVCHESTAFGLRWPSTM